MSNNDRNVDLYGIVEMAEDILPNYQIQYSALDIIISKNTTNLELFRLGACIVEEYIIRAIQ